jgi:hypothetical protein
VNVPILKRQTMVQAGSVLASVSVLPCLVDLEKKQEAKRKSGLRDLSNCRGVVAIFGI